MIEVGSSRFDRIINIPVLIEKPCFPVFIELLSGFYQKGTAPVVLKPIFATKYVFAFPIFIARTRLMRWWCTSMIPIKCCKVFDVSTTSCSIYVPNSFRVRITKRRIRMILSYDRALAAKPAQRYGESAEWETSAPQNLEKDRKTDMRWPVHCLGGPGLGLQWRFKSSHRIAILFVHSESSYWITHGWRNY